MIPFLISALVVIGVQTLMLKLFADSAASKPDADPFLDRSWQRAGKVSAGLWLATNLLSFIPIVGWALSLVAWVGVIMDRYKFGFMRTLFLGVMQVGLIGLTHFVLWFFKISLF